MTTVSELITDSYRQSNVLAIGASPTSNQQIEALRYLNRLVLSVLGNEVANELSPIGIGRNNINRPQGFPWYDQTPGNDWFIPKNTQLMFNLEDPVSLYLHPQPDDGSRFAVSDVSRNLNTNPVTLFGNGRQIEGLDSIVLDTDGLDAQWFYRQDTANWHKLSPLSNLDVFPFPEAFDFYFITLLAMHLNPAYDVELTPAVAGIFNRSKTQFQARYQSHIQMGSELGLIRMPKQSRDRDNWTYGNWGDPDASFNIGYPFRW